MIVKTIFALLVAVTFAEIDQNDMEESIEKLMAMGEKKNVAAVRALEKKLEKPIGRFYEELETWKTLPKEHAKQMKGTWEFEWKNNISPKMDQLILTSKVCEELYGDNPDCETKYSWDGPYETRDKVKTKAFQDEFDWYIREIIAEIEEEDREIDEEETKDDEL